MQKKCFFSVIINSEKLGPNKVLMQAIAIHISKSYIQILQEIKSRCAVFFLLLNADLHFELIIAIKKTGLLIYFLHKHADGQDETKKHP